MSATATPTRPRRVVLTARDYEGLEHLNALRAVRLDDLARLLSHLGGQSEPMRDRTARTLVGRWVALGLAEMHRNPRGGFAIVTSTAQTAEAVGAEALPYGVPAWRDLPHTLTTAAVAVQMVTKSGGTWTSDAQLHARHAEGHRPDGLVTQPNGTTWAVEVERTTKNASRWAQNITETLARYGRVAYACADDTARHLTKWADENLTADERARVRVQPLGGLAR